jgi:hypothetical protein
MRDVEITGFVRAMTERTRFIDEALERAIGAGATQVLIPGAGFDSHAYRSRELLASARVFEVDRPAMLAFKRRRVDALGGPPENLTYVPIDLERGRAHGAGAARIRRVSADVRDHGRLDDVDAGGGASCHVPLRELLTIGSEESARRYLTRADGTTVGTEGHAKDEALRKAALARVAEQASPEQRLKIEERMREQARHMAYRIAEAAVV